MLSTYHTVRQDNELFHSVEWQFVVLDESQAIKNRQAGIARSVHGLKARYRLALSGTPLENSLSDLWSLFRFINEPLLGSFSDFQRQYLEPVEQQGDREVHRQLISKVRPFILRRTKAEVAPDLPSLSRQTITVQMGEAQQKMYDEMLSATRNVMLGVDGTDVIHVLQALTRLRQLACHPGLLGHLDGESAKMEVVMEEMSAIRSQGSKVLVFSSFEQHLRLYEEVFQCNKWPYAWISGSASLDQRKMAVRSFQEDVSVQVLFITLKAGGTGLNLTAADYVILLDPWWNPQAEEQAIARAHRIGSEQPVHVLRFITHGSIEEKITHLQERKLSLSGDLFDDVVPSLDIDEIKSLFEA